MSPIKGGASETSFLRILQLSAFGIPAGGLLTILLYPFSFLLLAIGAMAGLLISATYTVYECYLFSGTFKGRKPLHKVLVKGSAYGILISISLILALFTESYARLLQLGVKDISYMGNGWLGQHTFMQVVLYGFLTGFTSQIVSTVFRAQGVFTGAWSFINGTYGKPAYESRILLEISFKEAGELRSKLGASAFRSMYNEVWDLITSAEPFVKAESVEYRKDGIRLVWQYNKGGGEAWLELLLQLRQAMDKKEESITGKYHLRPEIQACAHAGSVLVSQAGKGNLQLMYEGRTVDELELMHENLMDSELSDLISAELLNLIPAHARASYIPIAGTKTEKYAGLPDKGWAISVHDRYRLS